ncbi:hypothetical protein Hanom_Chr11g01059841 [Helianthus anomalus]
MATINLLLKQTHPLYLILLKHKPISTPLSTFTFLHQTPPGVSMIGSFCSEYDLCLSVIQGLSVHYKVYHSPPSNNHDLQPPTTTIDLRHSTVHHPASIFVTVINEHLRHRHHR